MIIIETNTVTTSEQFSGEHSGETTSKLTSNSKNDSQFIRYRISTILSDKDQQVGVDRFYNSNHRLVLLKKQNRGSIFQPLVWVMALLPIAFALGMSYGGKELIPEDKCVKPSSVVPGNTVHKLPFTKAVVGENIISLKDNKLTDITNGQSPITEHLLDKPIEVA